jgi:tRNA G37 N-methylase Trm5
MAFRELLREKLRDRLSERELELLPSGFQRVGNIIILNLREGLLKS